MTYREVIKDYQDELKDLGLEPEVVLVLVEGLFDLSRSDIYMDYDKKIDDKFVDILEEAIKLYIAGAPVQYIVGHSYFYGRRFKVDPNVLIPRPETEEMVSIILKKFPKNLKVLEIGTGSGVIAVTLNLEGGHIVTATDISDDALAIANENAMDNDADINLIYSDIYSDIDEKYDLIVSNPPYVGESEEIGRGVEYEPYEALFAGEAGLDLIEKIIKDLDKYLKPHGTLILEHGFKQAEMIKSLVRKYLKGYKAVTLKDLQNKPRFTIVRRSLL